MEGKLYKLINENDEEYLSSIPGTLGGNKRLKIYGRLDCPSANRWIKKGYYIKDRVFFIDEETAIKAGYRPCAVCMKKEYEEWKKQSNNLGKILKKRKIINKSLNNSNILVL